MNKNQTNYLRMYLSVQNLLDEKTSIWNTIPKIVEYKNKFDGKLSRIMELSEEAQRSVGVTERKTQLKNIIGIKLSALSGALQAYAHESGDMDLLKLVKTTESEIKSFKELDLLAYVKSITGQAMEKVKDLGDYGVTPEQITEILTSLDEFNVLIGRPRTILNNKYSTMSSIDELINAINDLLNKNMDKMMLVFKSSNPEFYSEYDRARVIVNM